MLSACDTFRGELRTDGVVGIARSFLAAGASSLGVSLWPVDDAATRELMALFYAYQNRYVKWESLWVIFVEVAPPPPPRPAPTSLTPSLSAVLPLCCLATAHVLRRDGGGARQRVRDV